MEYNKGILKMVLGTLAVLFCVILVVLNYRPIGVKHLLLQLLGVSGLIIMLFIYNKKYR